MNTTATRPNKYVLSRRAWPQSDDLINCTINGVDMKSVNGYHASVLTPQYTYIGKMRERNLPSNRAKLDFEVSANRVTAVSDDGEFTTLSNGKRIQKDFADYYTNVYPGAQWYNPEAGFESPVAIKHGGQLVAVIMPVKS